MFFYVLAAVADFGAMIRAACVRRQVAAAVRAANFQAGVAVQGTLENQVGESDSRLQRIADYIGKESIALKSLQAIHKSGGMQKQQNAEFLGLGPQGIEFGIRQFVAVHAAANFKTAEAELFNTVLHLLDGKVGMLQGQAAEAH